MNEKDFAHNVGDVVLVRWKDERIYFAKITSVRKHRRVCGIVFEDKDRGNVPFEDIFSVDSPADEFIVCVICKFGTSDSPNQIVLCDKCGVAYHQLCHCPEIPESALELTSPWICHFCQLSRENPYLKQSADRDGRMAFCSETKLSRRRYKSLSSHCVPKRLATKRRRESSYARKRIGGSISRTRIELDEKALCQKKRVLRRMVKQLSAEPALNRINHTSNLQVNSDLAQLPGTEAVNIPSSSEIQGAKPFALTELNRLAGRIAKFGMDGKPNALSEKGSIKVKKEVFSGILLKCSALFAHCLKEGIDDNSERVETISRCCPSKAETTSSPADHVTMNLKDSSSTEDTPLLNKIPAGETICTSPVKLPNASDTAVLRSLIERRSIANCSDCGVPFYTSSAEHPRCGRYLGTLSAEIRRLVTIFNREHERFMLSLGKTFHQCIPIETGKPDQKDHHTSQQVDFAAASEACEGTRTALYVLPTIAATSTLMQQMAAIPGMMQQMAATSGMMQQIPENARGQNQSPCKSNAVLHAETNPVLFDHARFLLQRQRQAALEARHLPVPAHGHRTAAGRSRVCVYCGGRASLVCIVCRNIWYCSLECQKRSYLLHCQGCAMVMSQQNANVGGTVPVHDFHSPCNAVFC